MAMHAPQLFLLAYDIADPGAWPASTAPSSGKACPCNTPSS